MLCDECSQQQQQKLIEHLRNTECNLCSTTSIIIHHYVYYRYNTLQFGSVPLQASIGRRHSRSVTRPTSGDTRSSSRPSRTPSRRQSAAGWNRSSATNWRRPSCPVSHLDPWPSCAAGRRHVTHPRKPSNSEMTLEGAGEKTLISALFANRPLKTLEHSGFSVNYCSSDHSPDISSYQLCVKMMCLKLRHHQRKTAESENVYRSTNLLCFSVTLIIIRQVTPRIGRKFVIETARKCWTWHPKNPEDPWIHMRRRLCATGRTRLLTCVCTRLHVCVYTTTNVCVCTRLHVCAGGCCCRHLEASRPARWKAARGNGAETDGHRRSDEGKHREADPLPGRET